MGAQARGASSLYLEGAALEEARKQADQLPSWDLRPWQLAELELLLSGALSPLTGYPSQADFDAVLRSGETRDGVPLAWPVSLDVDLDFAGTLQQGSTIALRDREGLLVALLDITDIWQPDLANLLERLGSQAPVVMQWLQEDCLPLRLSGLLRGIAPPCHYDFIDLRIAPTEVRQRLQRRGWKRVLAVMTGQPIGPGEHALITQRARELEANILLLPDGLSQAPGDGHYYARLRALTQSLARFPKQLTATALVPLPAHRGTVAETALRELVARNHGATHVMHLDTGQPAAAPALSSAIGVQPVAPASMCYLPDSGRYVARADVPEGEDASPASTQEMLARLQRGEQIPDWLGWPEEVAALKRAYPPRTAQGLTLFLTGLFGAGKSTLARALMGKLMEHGSRPVTLLDGDTVRRNLSSDLGFSREHRDLNLLRSGFVAAEITKNGGIAICASIAPSTRGRRRLRKRIESDGAFLEIHVATPLEVCEQRDRKGLYARARAGLITEFTGISDPYDTPESPEIRLDMTGVSPDQGAQEILLKLVALGYL